MQDIDTPTNQRFKDELVRLNHSPTLSNDASPLFLVHSLLGDPVQDFSGFAKLIGTDIPLWGLRSKTHFDPTLPAESIELIASSYIDKIQSVQRSGPYTIGGLSAGGTISWEIARQLENKNQSVILILMDSVSPDIWRNLEGSKHTEAVSFLGYFLLPPSLRDDQSILNEIKSAIEPFSINQIQLERLFDYLISVVSDPICLNNIRVARRILGAIYNYHPRLLHTEKIHLFKTSKAFIPSDAKMGWCVNGCRATIIDGNHESFLSEPQLISSIKKILEI